MSQAKLSQIRLGAISGLAVWRNRPIRYLILCGVTLIAAIVVSTAIMVGHFRDRALADSERELKNTALILAEQLDRSFQEIERVQSSVVAKVRSLGIVSSEDLARQMSGQDVNVLLRASISGLAQLDAIALLDADGKLLNYSHDWPIPAVNNADRDYFKALKSDAQLTSFISAPVLIRSAIFFSSRSQTGCANAFETPTRSPASAGTSSPSCKSVLRNRHMQPRWRHVSSR